MDIRQFDLKTSDAFTADLFRQQKRELAILNAIIQTVSSSYNLKETLEEALEIVLHVVGSQSGWICLLEEDKSCSAFVGHQGLCFATEDGKAVPCMVQCVCSRIRRTGEVVVIRQLSQGCPLLDSNTDIQKIVGHVSVPLTTKSRIVGQLNVAFGDQSQADGMDIDLLKTIAPQLAVAVENARLWEEVQDKEHLRKELLKKVVTAQEEERRRISRELHDEMGQELTSLLVRLQLLEKLEGNMQSTQIIADIKNSVSQMMTSIHDLALELRPTVLDDLGLVPALVQYARTCPANLGINVDFEVIGADNLRGADNQRGADNLRGSESFRGAGSWRLPREVETTLYRVIQESLTNVARHAGTQQASVLIKFNENSLVTIIEDHGVGFDPREVRSGPTKKNRLGLYGMEERVALVGGSLTIESSPGVGTSIYVEIPLSNS